MPETFASLHKDANFKPIYVFAWAEHNQLVHNNPVQCRVRENEAKVTHYSEQVFEKLFAYLKSLQADPAGALALYLILFHAFRVTELRLAQIPLAIPSTEEQSETSLTENYCLFIAPQPRPRANNVGRRPSLHIDFPQEAAHWLKPLLIRYEQHRASVGCTPRNNYLFLSTRSARHHTPVSKEHIRRLVSKVTRDVLGAVANASALRRTAGVIFADECPRRGAVLTRLGWGLSVLTNTRSWDGASFIHGAFKFLRDNIPIIIESEPSGRV